MPRRPQLPRLGPPRGRRPTWEPAAPPVPPRRPPSLAVVEQAYLTEVATGRLATIHPPRQWFRGAVHDAHGGLVRESQKVLGDRRGSRVAADPDRVIRSTSAARLDGTWLYGGTWASVFGHFLVETLTTLWPTLEERPAGLVFHSSFGRFTVADWHRRLIELAGYGDLPLRVVDRHDPLAVERLLVPGRAVSLHAWAHPEARQVWETVASGFRSVGGPARVYVSRTRLNAQRRRDGHRRPVRTTAQHDEDLDAVFAHHGFIVAHPEALDIDEQLATVASAKVLAGLSGSGLHHSAFMPGGGRVIELGDGRTSDHPVPMQVAIDAALGHDRAFLPGGATPKQVDRALGRLGL